jgi:hypothetical protein
MKHVKSLYISSDSTIISLPIDDIFSIKVSSKTFDIMFIDGKTQTFKLRLTEILNCIYDLTNFSQFFFVKDGLLVNPIHTEINKLGHTSHIQYEVVPKKQLNIENIVLSTKEMVTKLAKSKLIAQNIHDAHFQL